MEQLKWKDLLKKAGIIVLSAAAAWCVYAGATLEQHYYVYALVLGLGVFRLATGSTCPLVWALTKLGLEGLSCPSGNKAPSRCCGTTKDIAAGQP